MLRAAVRKIVWTNLGLVLGIGILGAATLNRSQPVGAITLAVHSHTHYDCNANGCESGTYKLDNSDDISGMQQTRYDKQPTTEDAGTNCGTPLDVNAKYVLQAIDMSDSSFAIEQFGTGQQCSGSSYTEYYFADYTDTSNTFHLARTQGITSHDSHTFYLWQNTLYTWDAQIGSTNWKTFTNNSSMANYEDVVLFSIANYPEAIAFGENSMNIQHNNMSWATYSGGAVASSGVPDPMCYYKVDGADWNVAEDPPNSTFDCT